MASISGKARITLSIEVVLSSTWDGDCTLQQIHDQAKREALEVVRRACEEEDIEILGEPRFVTFIGEETC